MELSNVLHVPDFQFNLLLVSKLCEQVTGKVIFTSTNCILQDPMLQEVVLGRTNSGLYHVQDSAKAAARAQHSGVAQQGYKQPILG